MPDCMHAEGKAIKAGIPRATLGRSYGDFRDNWSRLTTSLTILSPDVSRANIARRDIPLAQCLRSENSYVDSLPSIIARNHRTRVTIATVASRIHLRSRESERQEREGSLSPLAGPGYPGFVVIATPERWLTTPFLQPRAWTA